MVTVTVPTVTTGGRFEYFLGTKADAAELRAAGRTPDRDRVVAPPMPGPGWAVALHGNMVVVRPDASAALYREGLKIYPLADMNEAWLAEGTRGQPPEMEFVSATGVEFNTIHSNDVHF